MNRANYVVKVSIAKVLPEGARINMEGLSHTCTHSVRPFAIFTLRYCHTYMDQRPAPALLNRKCYSSSPIQFKADGALSYHRMPD